MKKMIFTLFMLVVVTLSASAQTIVSCNGSTARIDMNNDGIWDQEISVQAIPAAHCMKRGRNLYSELGRLYVMQLWRQYEAMGVNPASCGLPNPSGNGNFSQYASAYMPYLGMGGGMVPVGGMVGMPGQASIMVGGKNFGVGISVPVRSNNGSMMYTPNASVGVRVNGNYIGASVPVSVVTGKKNARTRTQAQTRTVAPTTTTTTTRTVTSSQNQTPIRVVGEMTPEEIQQMLNGDYM